MPSDPKITAPPGSLDPVGSAIPRCSCGAPLVKWGEIWRCLTVVKMDLDAGILPPPTDEPRSPNIELRRGGDNPDFMSEETKPPATAPAVASSDLLAGVKVDGCTILEDYKTETTGSCFGE